MSRSRSRSRERRKERRHKRSRSRRRSKDKKDRSRSRDRDRGRDYKKRDRSHSREKYSRKRSPEKSYERHRDKRRDSPEKRRRSSSSDDRHSKTRSSETVKPIIITASSIKHRSKAHRVESNKEAKVDHRKTFEISNEFSQEGFEQFSRDHGIDFSNIETDEDKQELHAKMEDVLKEHFAAQGKIYPPPKPEIPAINAATGFANDGSFLEQFKKMQEEYKQQMEDEKRRKAAEDRLKSLPLRRRGGGKILKTGIVAKTVTNPDVQPQQAADDALSLYLKELQKYKNSSCDGDSKTRPLVK